MDCSRNCCYYSSCDAGHGVCGERMDTRIATLPPVEEPKVGSYSRFTLSSRIFHLYRMPSSSRAYPKPLEEKAAVYKQMFEDLKMI